MEQRKMTDEEAKKVCDRIREVAYGLHLHLGTGYLEKVYENGLAHRLEKAGMRVERQVPVTVRDEDGFVLGEYVADLVVEGIVVELKAVSTLLPAHIAQTINYLKAMGMEHGMLVNFGSGKFQCRKLARSK